MPSTKPAIDIADIEPVKREASARMSYLKKLSRPQELAQETTSHEEKLDKIGQPSLPINPLVKKEFGAARQVTAVNHLVEQMRGSLAGQGVPKDQHMTVVAEAFMKVRQIDALGHTLMSEEELTAPPAERWSSSSKKWNNICDYLTDQYQARIGRGFIRSHLKVANMSAYDALRNWARNKSNLVPSNIQADAYDPELSVNPLTATAVVVKQRPSQRKSKTP